MATKTNPGYNSGIAITKSDTVDITCPHGRDVTDAIYVGGGGDINCVDEGGGTYLLVGALAGTIIPVAIRRVNSASTSATDLVALFSV
jgi:hypothetical protein